MRKEFLIVILVLVAAILITGLLYISDFWGSGEETTTPTTLQSSEERALDQVEADLKADDDLDTSDLDAVNADLNKVEKDLQGA